MILSEKEIDKILKEHTCYEGPHVSSFDQLGAAHAIAEKMAEGVVWQKECYGHELFDDPGAVLIDLPQSIEEERITVTVTKEEGDG